MGRQRAPRLRALASSLVAFSLLAAGSGCGANNSIEAVQTAVVSAQTAVPGAQATAQAGATLVSGALSTAQPVITMVQGLLAGVALDVKTTPDGADPPSVTDVSIRGTDAQGRLSQLDPQTRLTAASGALVAIGQYYPRANVQLTILDASGATLLSGSVAPGGTPSVQ